MGQAGYFEKIRVFKAGPGSLNIGARNNERGPRSCFCWFFKVFITHTHAHMGAPRGDLRYRRGPAKPPYKYTYILHTVEVGFYEPGFYEPSPFMNFFAGPLRIPISL